MKTIKHPIKSSLLLLTALFVLHGYVQAQTTNLNFDGSLVIEQENVDDSYSLDLGPSGIIYPNGYYVTYTIPSGTTKAISFHLRGGRAADATSYCNSNRRTAIGGNGADVEATFLIGTEPYSLRPGGQVRFAVGRSGRASTNPGGGAGGGGSTGIQYRPKPNDSWILLAVAGGGGGGSADGFRCEASEVTNGQGGRASERGGDGTGDNGVTDESSRGGSNGSAGKNGKANDNPPKLMSTGGSGISEAGSRTYDGYWNNAGGWGFTVGGAGDDSKSYAGGGGGGYSGGGGATYSGRGGGGGSYVNDNYAIIGKKFNGGNDSKPGDLNRTDGMVSYQAITDLSSLVDQSLPRIRLLSNDKKCIHADGENIEIQPCSDQIDAFRQQWQFDEKQFVLNAKPDKCLDLKGGYTSNGTNIQLWGCSGDWKNQQWIYDGIFGTIRSIKGFRKCLSLEGTSNNPPAGTNIHLWDCKEDNVRQEWLMDGATKVENPTWIKTIRPVASPELCINLEEASTAAGNNVRLWTCDDTGSRWHNWTFDVDGQIHLANSQYMCLGVLYQTNNVHIWNCQDDNHGQVWIYDGITQAFRWSNDKSKCLQVDLGNGSYEKRDNMIIANCDGGKDQRFTVAGTNY